MKYNSKSILIISCAVAISCLAGSAAGFSMTIEELDHKIKNSDTTFYREFFENVFYKQFVKFLRFDQLTEEVKTPPALDVNIFDEIPDSNFFANRQGKQPLSKSDLLRGGEKSSGPDPADPWTIIKGKMEGVSIGLFIQDSKGDKYILKFDPKDYPEMMTSAEAISQKFFYAIGYHVPEYYLVEFKPDILKIDPKATYYNDDGFKKPLTQDALDAFLERIPKMKGGIVRASASKLLKNVQGHMSFEGRRKEDPGDLIPHEDRRSIRALRVFGSWLNHYDLREGNTLDVIEEENGNAFVKHYLIDFGATLGSASYQPKVPVAGHEHIVDWFEVGKTTPTLKVVEKSWERHWDALKRQIAFPAIGYFDNAQFDPGSWKTQLPYEVFTRLGAADAFWAAKIIMAFSSEDIEAVVDSAHFSDPEDAKTMTSILTVRRDVIGKYWFSRVTPLDKIALSNLDSQTYQIKFEDLNVKYHFVAQDEPSYRFKLEFLAADGKKTEIDHQTFKSESFSFQVPSPDVVRATIWVQAKYGSEDHWSEPPLRIVLGKTQNEPTFSVVEIDHGT